MLFLHFQSPPRHPKRLLQSHSSEASGHWGRPSQTSNPITHPEPSAHSKSPDWQTNSIKYDCLLVFYSQRNNQVQPDQLNKWAQKTFQEQVVSNTYRSPSHQIHPGSHWHRHSAICATHTLHHHTATDFCCSLREHLKQSQLALTLQASHTYGLYDDSILYTIWIRFVGQMKTWNNKIF